MSLSGDRLARAEQRSSVARARLRETASELKARLTPRRLLQDAVHEARRASESIADAGAGTARRHPIALMSLVAGLAAIALRRKRHRRRTGDETDAEARRLNPERARPRRTRKSA